MVNPSEPAKEVAVIDSDDDSSQRLSFDKLANHNSKDRLRGVHTFTAWAFLTRILDKFLQIFVDSAGDLWVAIEDFGNSLVTAVILVCNFQIRGLIIELGLAILFLTQKLSSSPLFFFYL